METVVLQSRMSEDQHNHETANNGLYFDPSLIRKLIFCSQQQQQYAAKEKTNKTTSDNNIAKNQKRITNGAVQCVSELLHMFVTEARNRASIEAECEHEAFDIDDKCFMDEQQHQHDVRLSKKKANPTYSFCKDDDNDSNKENSDKSCKSDKKRYHRNRDDTDNDSICCIVANGVTNCLPNSPPAAADNSKNKKRKQNNLNDNNSGIVTIRADHVTKIAAELFWDYS